MEIVPEYILNYFKRFIPDSNIKEISTKNGLSQKKTKDDTESEEEIKNEKDSYFVFKKEIMKNIAKLNNNIINIKEETRCGEKYLIEFKEKKLENENQKLKLKEFFKKEKVDVISLKKYLNENKKSITKINDEAEIELKINSNLTFKNYENEELDKIENYIYFFKNQIKNLKKNSKKTILFKIEENMEKLSNELCTIFSDPLFSNSLQKNAENVLQIIHNVFIEFKNINKISENGKLILSSIDLVTDSCPMSIEASKRFERLKESNEILNANDKQKIRLCDNDKKFLEEVKANYIGKTNQNFSNLYKKELKEKHELKKIYNKLLIKKIQKEEKELSESEAPSHLSGEEARERMIKQIKKAEERMDIEEKEANMELPQIISSPKIKSKEIELETRKNLLKEVFKSFPQPQKKPKAIKSEGSSKKQIGTITECIYCKKRLLSKNNAAHLCVEKSIALNIKNTDECKKCGKTMMKSSLRNHMKKCRNVEYIDNACIICGQVVQNVENHMKKYHKKHENTEDYIYDKIEGNNLKAGDRKAECIYCKKILRMKVLKYHYLRCQMFIKTSLKPELRKLGKKFLVVNRNNRISEENKTYLSLFSDYLNNFFFRMRKSKLVKEEAVDFNTIKRKSKEELLKEIMDDFNLFHQQEGILTNTTEKMIERVGITCRQIKGYKKTSDSFDSNKNGNRFYSTIDEISQIYNIFGIVLKFERELEEKFENLNKQIENLNKIEINEDMKSYSKKLLNSKLKSLARIRLFVGEFRSAFWSEKLHKKIIDNYHLLTDFVLFSSSGTMTMNDRMYFNIVNHPSIESLCAETLATINKIRVSMTRKANFNTFTGNKYRTFLKILKESEREKIKSILALDNVADIYVTDDVLNNCDNYRPVEGLNERIKSNFQQIYEERGIKEVFENVGYDTPEFNSIIPKKKYTLLTAAKLPEFINKVKEVYRKYREQIEAQKYPPVIIKDSPGKGKGVFALIPIPEYTLIGEYLGKLRLETDDLDLQFPHLNGLYTLLNNSKVNKKLPNILLDPYEYGNYCYFVNGCIYEDGKINEDQSREINTIAVSGQIDGKARVLYFTIRAIDGNEELIMDYGASYWETRDEILAYASDNEINKLNKNLKK